LTLCCCLFCPSGCCGSLPGAQGPVQLQAQAQQQAEVLCELKELHAGLYWYRWNPQSQGFQFLLFASPWGPGTYGSNISHERFRLHGQSRLHIQQLQHSDTGTYYCSSSQASQLLLGTGTQLTVVDALPLPPEPTQAPVTKKKPLRCTRNSPAADSTVACSPLVWIPLALSILVLLLSLVPTAHHLHRMRRRLWLRIHRQ
ncbi:CD8B protein, partial [Bucco capensis]|nr:CD8B protein [Bucco capensis]